MGGSMDTFGEEIDNSDTIQEKLGYQFDILPVTPDSKQPSLETTSENTYLTIDSSTSQPPEDINSRNGDIIFPVKHNNLSSVLDMVHMCEDDGS